MDSVMAALAGYPSVEDIQLCDRSAAMADECVADTAEAILAEASPNMFEAECLYWTYC
jgi:hypothetical protein